MTGGGIMVNTLLQRSDRPQIMRPTGQCAAACVFLTMSFCAMAQQPAEPKKEDLDVTMQIIVDPAATRPEEVIRKIPLPARKPAAQPDKPTKSESDQSSPSAKGSDRAREAREHGSEMAERARERAQEAADQREQARRSAAEEHRPTPPPAPPGRPPRP
jgi:hypothetical protein